MKIRCDPDADAMYIELVNAVSFRSKEIDDNLLIGYDKKGNVIGIEILFVKERMPKLLKELKEENLIAA